MTADLVRFLRERHDEDERAAHWADDGAGANWEACFTGHLKEHMGITEVGSGFVFVDGFQDVAFGAAVLVARHDPARVLAEVEAKRRILARHARPDDDPSQPNRCFGCGIEDYNGDPVTANINDCPELRDLASVYADHPDYREEWRPAAE